MRRRRNLLLLSRTRVQADLGAATDQRYRDQLGRALTDIEAEIQAAGGPDTTLLAKLSGRRHGGS